ncbi:MAG: ABC transporter permease [Candidatus Acidiferrales bacterium]
MRNARRIWMAGILLAAIHGAVLLAGFIAPYGFSQQAREFPYAPPSRLHFVDARGHLHLVPFIYRLTPDETNPDAYAEDRSQAYPIRLFVRGAGYKFAGLVDFQVHLFGVDAPAQIFILGTDGYGRDQFSRLLYGGRISLLAGLLAAGLALGFGLLVGGISGYYGGWIDDSLMRVSELFLALPWIYLLFAVRAFLPLNLAPFQTFLLLIGVVGLVGWARPARLIRGVVLSAREREFVVAARGFGASDAYLLRRHILPQAWGVLLTQAAILIPQFILAEVTLSFLGLGIGEPGVSWGSMLSSLQEFHVLSSYWWMLAPGVALVFVSLGYTALANTLQEKFGPSEV